MELPLSITTSPNNPYNDAFTPDDLLKYNYRGTDPYHAAFDQNIIGINPDYQIKVRKNSLEEIDGPMLKYGILFLENEKLILPGNWSNWPDRERLGARFEGFLNAG